MFIILPIMLLSNIQNQAYHAQYYAFNIIIMLNKMLLDCSIFPYYWLLYSSKWLLYLSISIWFLQSMLNP